MKHITSFNEAYKVSDLISKLHKIFSKRDLDKMRIKLADELNKYKISAKKKTYTKEEINELIAEMNDTFGKKIVEYLNLDGFLRGLQVMSLSKNKNKKIDSYFNEYIMDLPNRIKDIKEWEDQSDEERFSDDEEFEELMKLKSTMKPKLSKKEFINEKRPLQVELNRMSEWLKETGNKLILIFEGRDAAGKGSAIKNITEFLPVKQYKIATFDIPTEEEKHNWFKRYEAVLPKPGHITFYDRSWYNRAINDPVMGYCTFDEYEKFMKDVIPFEKKLISDDYIIMKFWFSINKDIQELRFKMRQASPLKYWKFSENDLKTMSKWDQFTKYKERMLKETTRPNARWVVVDSNDKRTAQLNVMRYILSNIPYDNKDEELVNEIYPEVIIEIE